ncbi:flagellar hook-length control protein FliK [Rhodophyticola sp. CCM32]|uniref:flagellar hook-length control protein FliK n=1 Tax=Rhodophyticola sp. CCM32 TaxID=2916397 RepID=UPI00143CC7E2|nr:flagellar hook-length control protein FliK [Rhodophyticola sp. CCM32]
MQTKPGGSDISPPIPQQSPKVAPEGLAARPSQASVSPVQTIALDTMHAPRGTIATVQTPPSLPPRAPASPNPLGPSMEPLARHLAAGSDLPLTELLADPSILSHTPGSSAPLSTIPGPQTTIAQSAATQMAAALHPQAGRPVLDHPTEIALDPPELGRVRMVFNQIDGVMALSITADRPETLDLMRRHADLLAQEFFRAGLGDTAFSFQQREDNPASGSPTTGEQGTKTPAPEDPAPVTGPGHSTHDGALDLRL